MSIDYAQQKLWEAIYTLVGDDTIQERLRFAGIALASVGPVAFEGHPDLGAQFRAVYRRLSRGAIGPDGLIAATTARLSDREGADIAREIFGLFCRVSEVATNPVGFNRSRRPDEGGS